MKNFSENSFKYLRYFTGAEFSKNGDQVVDRAIKHYFAPNKSLENQLSELEKVINKPGTVELINNSNTI
jgi:hypothetical protein